jgi:spoIIIJ-associated protein
MKKYIETTGRNEEEAIAAALSKLGLERDDVSVEVIDRAKSGFLGIGSTPAKVRVSYEAPEEPVPVVKEVTPVAEAPKKMQTVAKKEAAVPVAAPVAVKDDVAAEITGFLNGLFSHMDIVVEPVITLTEEGNYDVVLQGENLGALIGRRGETLDAIQQITSYAVNRTRSKRARIHLDAENYRAKREEALQRLAEKTAVRVIKYRRNVVLESMNAYERHVIHTALQEYPNVSTFSTGTEPNRRTVVAYSPQQP